MSLILVRCFIGLEAGLLDGPRYDIDTETWVVEEMAVEELEAAFDEKAWTPSLDPASSFR